MDISYDELLHTLRGLATAARKSKNFDPATSSFVWFNNLIQLKLTERLVYRILYNALPLKPNTDNGFLAYLIDKFSGMLDSVTEEGRHTVLFKCVELGLHESAKIFMEKGAGLHTMGCDYYSYTDPWQREYSVTSEYLHSITSRSLLCSERFVGWRDILRMSHINIDGFIKSAVLEEPLINAGWNESSLRTIFELDFEAKPQPEFHHNSDCGCSYMSGSGCLVEVEWMQMLERIKSGKEAVVADVEWICERCWYAFRDGVAELPRKKVREVARGTEEEGGDSHFLLSI